MPQPLGTGALSRLLTLGLWAAMPLVIALAACGHGAAPPAAAPPPPSASASGVPAPAAPAPSAPSGSTAAVPASAAPLPPAPVPISTVATARSDPSWAACHRSAKARVVDLASDVAALAAGCAASTRMKLVGGTRTGKQAAEDAPQSFALEAKGHHCYRVYARAADTIEDLDVVVKDSAGVVIGQDSTDDRSPVVLDDGEVCFRQDDKASVVVSVGMGKGSYALQIWGD